MNRDCLIYLMLFIFSANSEHYISLPVSLLFGVLTIITFKGE